MNNFNDEIIMVLKLLDIRTSQLNEIVAFYKSLGLEFGYLRQEKGTMHYSTEVGKKVFEIYHLQKKSD